MDLTFGEQVKIILSRKNMTIKELAELFEEETGKKMSRQNMTQRLGPIALAHKLARQLTTVRKRPQRRDAGLRRKPDRYAGRVRHVRQRRQCA